MQHVYYVDSEILNARCKKQLVIANTVLSRLFNTGGCIIKDRYSRPKLQSAAPEDKRRLSENLHRLSLTIRYGNIEIERSPVIGEDGENEGLHSTSVTCDRRDKGPRGYCSPKVTQLPHRAINGA